ILPLFGTFGVMLVAGGLLLICVIFNRLVSRFRQSFSSSAHAAEEKPLERSRGAFRLILKSRYLFWIAILIVVGNVVNSTGEFILSKLVVENADRAIALGTV